MLRATMKQRLTAAVEEIFGLFERTIAEYEEEVSRSKQENDRQRKLLDAVLNPEIRLHRAGLFTSIDIFTLFIHTLCLFVSIDPRCYSFVVNVAQRVW